MNYSISILINLKNNSNHLNIENLIYDSGISCNSINIYTDFELEGINNYIKKNNKIIILEFDNTSNISDFIKFIKYVSEIIIESIYSDNKILYATKKYLNSLNKNLHDKNELEKVIETNKLLEEYTQIYRSLLR
tara:strand:- start:30 stop:431 length:402 start_codon:yes stop_codon:yes gene_type:complete